MRRSDFRYDLPEELIAQEPLPNRSDSRLLCVDSASAGVADRRIRELPELLRRGDLLVFNDTRVIAARIWGNKPSGGGVEVLIERIIDDRRALVQVRPGKSVRDGAALVFGDGIRARIARRAGDFYELEFAEGLTVFEVLDAIGRTPLPPYILRDDRPQDRERYQTIFAAHNGAVAAPTAGLHFDGALLRRLADKGIGAATVTLHIGAGTFRPVRSENLEEHRMHPEWLEVDAVARDRIRETREAGGRVIAVGTTVVRALETASRGGEIETFTGDTDIFITPGHQFRSVDALITNFHMPGSTLLMLVCAFAGTERVLAAYRHAVAARYRFFSYGDAMLLS